MAFHNVIFPTDISYGSKGGPGFNTNVIEIGSGFENRSIDWSQVRSKYDVAYGVTTGGQLEALIAFFRARMGKAHWFKYKDWTDYQGINQICPPATFQPDEYSFQLQKVYSSGAYNYVRNIIIPEPSNILVYVNGVLQPNDYSIFEIWGPGVIYFYDIPVGTITATFDFYVPVRFDTDNLSISLDNYNSAGTYFGGASVPLIEVSPLELGYL